MMGLNEFTQASSGSDMKAAVLQIADFKEPNGKHMEI
jgi:hypothetical protein